MTRQTKEPYAAFIGLDWADQKHDYYLSVVGTDTIECGTLASRPESVAADTFLLVFGTGVRANCLLALFNLLPIPMLDGWEVYAGFIPAMKRLRPDQVYAAGWIAILILVLTPAWRLLSIASQSLASLLLRGA